jgi:hypothetical protein
MRRRSRRDGGRSDWGREEALVKKSDFFSFFSLLQPWIQKQIMLGPLGETVRASHSSTAHHNPPQECLNKTEEIS